MTKRPLILVSTRYFLPGHKTGGPSRSLANLIEALGNEFEFKVLTSDRDLTDTQPYPGIAVDHWLPVGKASVCYLAPGWRRRWQLLRLLHQVRPDVLYLNELMDPEYSMSLMLARSVSPKLHRTAVVLAPRGQLTLASLAIKSFKKRVFLRLARATGLYRSVTWHASSNDEQMQIAAHFGSRANCVVAQILPTRLPVMADPGALEDSSVEGSQLTSAAQGKRPLRLLFLSRISRIKNLDFVLRTLVQCKAPIALDVWGPLEEAAYWQQCQTLMAALPKHVTARYCGVAQYASVTEIMAGSDLFFLPTHGENYGHVIAEALAAGTPVLLSDQTPWRGLQQAGVGWDMPLAAGEAAFAAVIDGAAAYTAAQMSAWRQRVKTFAHEQLSDPSVLVANRALFTISSTQQTRR